MRGAVLGLLVFAGCAHAPEPWPVDEALLRGRNAYVAQPPAEPRASPVNVVLLVADDLGRGDTSMYGGTAVQTPSIDRIAKEGVAFTSAYVTSPICSPSRAALLTGRYQQRFGHEGQPHERYAQNGLEYFVFKNFVARGDWRLTRFVSPPAEAVQKQGLPLSEVTLAEVMKRAGYATGFVGKWHLGWNDDVVPQHRGFDSTFGFYEAFSLYQADVNSPGVVNVRHDDFSEEFIWGKGRKGTAAIRRDGVVVEEPGYLTDRLADEAVAFIEKNRARPFFLYVPFNAPHTPFQAKKAVVDRFAAEPDLNRRVYLALIASLDEAVGRILGALDARGLAKDTLVVFLSDNGAALYTHATTNAPYKLGKMSLFEGGLRVPFAMRWPARLPEGARYEAPVSSLDVFATAAAAVGAPVPGDRPYDGVDLAPFVRGERTGQPHESLFWRSTYTRAVRKGSLKFIVDELGGATRLYDLAADPYEKTNLAPARPEVVRALELELMGWEAQCRAPLWPHVMDYRNEDDGEVLWFPL